MKGTRKSDYYYSLYLAPLIPSLNYISFTHISPLAKPLPFAHSLPSLAYNKEGRVNDEGNGDGRG